MMRMTISKNWFPLVALLLLLAAQVQEGSGFVQQQLPLKSQQSRSTSSGSTSLEATRLVWLTGYGDLRIHDHSGFAGALLEQQDGGNNDDVVVPIFLLDPKIHLRSQSTSTLQRLHSCLQELEKQLLELSENSSFNISPLLVKEGSASWAIPSIANELDAKSCHVITNDVVGTLRTAQQAACAALTEMNVKVERWDPALRPTAPWSSIKEKNELLPSFFPDYCEIADSCPVEGPNAQWNAVLDAASKDMEEDAKTKTAAATNLLDSFGKGVPSWEEFQQMATEATPDAVVRARKTISTMEPYDSLVTHWSTASGSKKALQEYTTEGKDSFANKYLIGSDAANLGKGSGSKSLYSASAARILKGQGGNQPSEVLALRETPTRAFSSALSLGSLSTREVLDAARNKCPGTPPAFLLDAPPNVKNVVDPTNNQAKLLPSDDPFWGRSSEGSLADVVEWREWYHLLAQRSLQIQESSSGGSTNGASIKPTSGGEKAMTGDVRESGKIDYWRWKNQHLVRYMTWEAGKDYDGESPALLLVHGFAASVEQWERLVHSLRTENVQKNGGNKDTTPPIYAIDLLGFGHSEKPGLSYTQYLWESQLVDFALEVMEAQPMVLVGNSIGGGLSAGAASTLGPEICRGLVLCNTAGILIDPNEYTGYPQDLSTSGASSYTEAALQGNPDGKPYSTVPVVGNNALDLFGRVIVQSIYPQIEKRLSLIYRGRMQNADPAVTYAIQQAAVGPGSANVVGSGAKLAPNRPLNEVLKGFPTLVVMGLDDQVSTPQVAAYRAELFSRLYPKDVTVRPIEDAGHCPHDEVPDKVAKAMVEWLASPRLSSSSSEETIQKNVEAEIEV